MATLRLNYKDVWTKVSEFLGLGSSPTGTNLTKCKDIVLRAYRKFLMPIDSSTVSQANPGGKIHRWKFLELTTTLSTAADIDTYNLPKGFSSFVTTFTHTTPTTWNPVQKPLSFIYEQKSRTTGTGYPVYFAIKNGDYDVVAGQQYEVVFSPTPNGTYNYYYTFIFMPQKPVNDEDLFVGDELTSEVILECALAVAELQEDEKAGFHNQEADRLLQALIGKDKQDGLVPYLGQISQGPSNVYAVYSELYDADGNRVLPEE